MTGIRKRLLRGLTTPTIRPENTCRNDPHPMPRDTRDSQLTEDLPVGGQAVIEGVMIRAEDKVVTAVRTPEQQIVVREDIHVPWGRRLRLLRVPVLRGAVAFFEMMIIGLRTLNFSADMAMQGEEAERPVRPEEDGWKNKLALGLTLAVSLGLGIGLFFFLPLFAAQLTGASRNAVEFNLIAGLVRMVLFLSYLWGISHWSEIRRVFEYHGAEHKSIFNHEAGADLTVEKAREFGRLHPRCGTSFLLIVVLVSIFVFAFVDSAFVVVFGHLQSLLERFATHLSLLPFVSGLSFELLKLSGRKRNHPVTRILIAPGLWLQRITTREPTDDQLEVALVALRHALGKASPVEYTLWDAEGEWRSRSRGAAAATGIVAGSAE